MADNERINADDSNQEQSAQEIKERLEEYRVRAKEANEALREGKGRMRLEKPIISGDQEITELVYDFTEMTGLDYTSAMDSDPNAMQAFKITYRQGLALFAAAAAKNTELVDQRDIVEQIGMTDAVEGVQIATLFFSASTRAGHLRISKK